MPFASAGPGVIAVASAIGVAWSTPTAAPVSVEIEDFEMFLRDGETLRQEHAAEAGKPSASFNVALARGLEAIGAGQIMVARSGGRMVGYLVFLVAPSLECEGEIAAMQNVFYVTPSYRKRLGIALLRASIDALWARGASEIMLRAGVLADGFRLDALYQRLGGVLDGRLYRLTRPAA